MASTSGDRHQGEGGGGDERQGGGGEDEEGHIISYQEVDDDEEDINDVVEVGAEDDLEEQQGGRGGNIDEAHLVPILNLPPIDSLPPFSLASEADLLLLLHGLSPQSCKIRKGKLICAEEGGCENQGGEICVMAKIKKSWLEKLKKNAPIHSKM